METQPTPIINAQAYEGLIYLTLQGVVGLTDIEAPRSWALDCRWTPEPSSRNSTRGA